MSMSSRDNSHTAEAVKASALTWTEVKESARLALETRNRPVTFYGENLFDLSGTFRTDALESYQQKIVEGWLELESPDCLYKRTLLRKIERWRISVAILNLLETEEESEKCTELNREELRRTLSDVKGVFE